ncbi:MAG TPA: DMT family transporter [Acidimicrobiia bacterium]|nr:DMT family transporter [Acidimicrobiia bacterium]
MKRRFVAEGALVAAALFYGVTFPLVHDALADITPFAFLVGRFGIATLLLAPVSIPALRARGPDRRMLVRAGLTAGVILFGGYATQTIGLQYTSPSTSAFLTGLYVVITPVIESAISRRLPRPPVVAGIVIATGGLYLLTGADVHLGRGEVLTLVGAVLFAFHIVYIGAYTHVLRPLPFGTMQMGAVALLSVGPAAHAGSGSLTTLAVVAVVFTGVACSAVALPLQLWGQQRIPATRAALILLAEPVFAGIAGYINGERLGVERLAGAAAILVGIAVSEFWPRRPVPPNTSSRDRLST